MLDVLTACKISGHKQFRMAYDGKIRPNVTRPARSNSTPSVAPMLLARTPAAQRIVAASIFSAPIRTPCALHAGDHA